MCVNSTKESEGVACRHLANHRPPVCQSFCMFRFTDFGLAGVSLEGGVSQRGNEQQNLIRAVFFYYQLVRLQFKYIN